MLASNQASKAVSTILLVKKLKKGVKKQKKVKKCPDFFQLVRALREGEKRKREQNMFLYSCSHSLLVDGKRKRERKKERKKERTESVFLFLFALSSC